MAKPLIDPTYRNKVLTLMHERHAGSLRNERFDLEVRREGDEAVVCLTLKSDDRTSVYTMEAAIERSKYLAMSEPQAIDICLDFLDWYVDEYFREERDAFLPLDWKSHTYGDVEVLARGDLRNEFLDEAADAWLRGERPDVETAWKQIRRK
jgi:hypothetical protein